MQEQDLVSTYFNGPVQRQKLCVLFEPAYVAPSKLYCMAPVTQQNELQFAYGIPFTHYQNKMGNVAQIQ